MASPDPNDIWPELDELGEEEVRKKLAMGVYGKRKIPIIEEWLRKQSQKGGGNPIDNKSKDSENKKPGALIGEPPPLLQHLKWLVDYGWAYKWYVVVAALLLFTVWVFTTESSAFLDRLSGMGARFVEFVKPVTPTVNIEKIELVSAEIGSFPHDDERLYTFSVHGNYTLTADRDQYAIIVFYKDLAQADQRYGWFVVEKLNSRGFAEPNLVNLGELDPSRWEFYTSRVYLPSESKLLIAMRAVILPIDKLKNLKPHILEDRGGRGKESLSFLTDLQGVIASNRVVFGPADFDRHVNPDR